ncbi:hypothetical protein JOD63_002539 [Microbacterium terrae]|uniref:BioF2-like acetyltransferase domain-containing protein n=1 Tax=Microbacterium terrae TaxID=69369 RepID=A0A0M2H8J0_9MICO|nr:GNAT family N-acetyltransferase [Microbacterium terrae]KJL42716.1 hypothetical protein RS81_01057 [Microbacterium terrae]MBP1078571.1 hypothetical protein [Microbacterium terrae]GLJ97971.1 hypothetical protein GCM10017594_11680 [Microbacterium terrae]
MRATLLRLSEVTDAEASRWAALAKRAAEPNAALDPRFLLPDRDTSGGHLLVVAEEDGEWFGLLRVFPIDTAATFGVTTFGTLEPSELGPPFPLLDRSRSGDALTAIAWGIRRLLRGGYLALRGYPATGPLAEALEAARSRTGMGALVVATRTTPWVDVHPMPDSSPTEHVYSAQVDPDYRSVGTRKELRRNARRLTEATGGPLTLRDASDDPAAIDRFIAMQASGWKGDGDRGGYAVALDADRERAFRDKMRAFAATGDLILLELWGGTQHVYSHVYVVSEGVAVGVLDAYQHEYARYSTGKLGRTAVTAHLRHSGRLQAMNPGYYYDGDEEAVRAYPDRRDFDDVVIGVGAVPALAVRLLPRADASKTAQRMFTLLSRADRLVLRVVDRVNRRGKAKS